MPATRRKADGRAPVKGRAPMLAICARENWRQRRKKLSCPSGGSIQFHDHEPTCRGHQGQLAVKCRPNVQTTVVRVEGLKTRLKPRLQVLLRLLLARRRGTRCCQCARHMCVRLGQSDSELCRAFALHDLHTGCLGVGVLFRVLFGGSRQAGRHANKTLWRQCEARKPVQPSQRLC